MKNRGLLPSTIKIRHFLGHVYVHLRLAAIVVSGLYSFSDAHENVLCNLCKQQANSGSLVLCTNTTHLFRSNKLLLGCTYHTSYVFPTAHAHTCVLHSSWIPDQQRMPVICLEFECLKFQCSCIKWLTLIANSSLYSSGTSQSVPPCSTLIWWLMNNKLCMIVCS